MSPPLHVEVVAGRTLLRREIIESLVNSLLLQFNSLTPGTTIHSSTFPEDSPLCEHVRCIQLCDAGQEGELPPATTDFVFHVYAPDQVGAATDSLPSGDEDDGPPAATYWTLPSEDFLGVWENLVYDTSVKEDLLHFVETTLLFSDCRVDANIINWNRVILLHGPPGTGKTSLCKALAQKLSIRLESRYRRTQLVEVNSHSLFSKWFSESGKLVLKLFDKIKEIIEDKETLVCVLIDEVESLTHARKSALSGFEPSDSIRVVNAVLTQIDQIQKYPNVIIMTTSNMTGAIDLAFVDRADIKRYIGLPSVAAIYQIYYTCLTELMRTGIVSPAEHIFTHKLLQMCHFSVNETTKKSMELLSIAKLSKGLSGRSLRKIPFLAHALFVHRTSSCMSDFLSAMSRAVQQKLLENDYFEREISAIKIDNERVPNGTNEQNNTNK